MYGELYQLEFYYRDGCNGTSTYISETVYTSKEIADKYKKMYENERECNCNVVKARIISE